MRGRFGRERTWEITHGPSSTEAGRGQTPETDGDAEAPTPKLTQPSVPYPHWDRDACGPTETYIRKYEMLPAIKARKYFHESAVRFEDFAAEEFLPVLDIPRAGDLILLSAVTYVATRAVEGHEAQLREIFVTPRSGAGGRDIHRACLDGLVATTQDRTALARFLAEVGSQADPPPGRSLCIDGLRRLQPEANDAMFALLAQEEDPHQRRRLAVLVQRVTRERSPEPLRFWSEETSGKAITAAIDTWRAAVNTP